MAFSDPTSINESCMQYASTLIEVSTRCMCASLTHTCGTEHTCASIIGFVCRLCLVCQACRHLVRSTLVACTSIIGFVCTENNSCSPPVPLKHMWRSVCAVMYIQQYLPFVLSSAKEHRTSLLCSEAFYNTCGRLECFQKIAVLFVQCHADCRGSVFAKVCMMHHIVGRIVNRV